MIACPACGAESPDGSTHCVQCGATLSVATDEAPGHTSHFGDQDVKKLVARITREEEAAAHEGDGNLLAGLPRPKAASMVSPLRGGQTTASTRGARPEQRRARSASGSTVLGMPLYTTGEQGAIRPAAARRDAVSAPPIEAEGLSASIQSLGAFQDDLGVRRGSGAPGDAPPASAVRDAAAQNAASPPADSAAASAGFGGDARGDLEPAAVTTERAPESSRQAEVPGASVARARPAADAPDPAVEAAPVRTATGPLDPSRPASSSKAGTIAAAVVLAVVLAIVAFIALR